MNCSPGMKAYTVLFAEDVPHYGFVDIQAPDAAAAIAAAKAYSYGDVVTEPEWGNTRNHRIVEIQDENSQTIAMDIALAERCDNPDTTLVDALEKAYVLLDRIRETCEYEAGLPVTFLEARDIEIIHGDAITELPAIKAVLEKARAA